ncbi:MAG: biotin synthase BioB [Thermodesulfovibrionales bacterium]|nr:biotin synthase BioB [Thermodesulfovibrionales bacterium]
MTRRTEIESLEEKVSQSQVLSRDEALVLAQAAGSDIFTLFASANKIREHFRGNKADVCSIINAKSGACSEDCSFCAQSSRSRAEIPVYPLLSKETLIPKAVAIKEAGIKRFSLVTSGKNVSERDLCEISGIIPAIKKLGLSPCASLGLLNKKELEQLRDAGLDRYHHNLETSARFFPEICSTHSYSDKIKAIEAAKSAGLSLCSGGIFGMGETWEDRIDMAFALKKLDVDSVPINFLIPLKGTGFADRNLLHPLEALKIISIYRFLLPEKQIRVCGGRLQVLGEFHSMIFFAGADGMITGNYLTTLGRSPRDDFRLIEQSGLVV